MRTRVQLFAPLRPLHHRRAGGGIAQTLERCDDAVAHPLVLGAGLDGALLLAAAQVDHNALGGRVERDPIGLAARPVDPAGAGRAGGHPVAGAGRQAAQRAAAALAAGPARGAARGSRALRVRLRRRRTGGRRRPAAGRCARTCAGAGRSRGRRRPRPCRRSPISSRASPTSASIRAVHLEQRLPQRVAGLVEVLPEPVLGEIGALEHDHHHLVAVLAQPAHHDLALLGDQGQAAVGQLGV